MVVKVVRGEVSGVVCCCCRADVAVTVGDVWRRWGLELLQTSRDP